MVAGGGDKSRSDAYGPPHYRMGYALCQLMGSCAPWPGEKRWVLICFTSVCVGCSL
jgi:hypothetical protein